MCRRASKTWLIDFDYKPIDDVLLYAKYSRGYRQGSVNVANYGLDHWGPEQVDTYEVGSKTSFQSFVRGSFNFAAFYNKFTDQQLLLGEVACSAISQPQCPFIPASAAGIINAGRSAIKGFEAETTLNLFRGLNADINYSYLFTRIESADPSAPPARVSTVRRVEHRWENPTDARAQVFGDLKLYATAH